MKEYNFIKYITGKRRRSPAQLNAPFEADAEIVRLNGSRWAITVDEFSAEEDFFRHKEAQVIGWNLAAATLSDLFACGVRPKFFLQTLLSSDKDDVLFYKRLMDGIFEALGACDCFLLGGDVGSAAAWRYSGIALGEVENEAVTRVMRRRETFDIWFTGTCGDANAAVLRHGDISRFELRLAEAAVVGEFASACTDTSGGVCDALRNLKQVNPGFDFEINLDAVPFDPEALETVRQHELAPELLLIGGAGEYELLVLASVRAADEFKRNPAFTKIGSGYPVSGGGGIEFFRDGTRCGAMRQEPPCYRSCAAADYLKTTLEYYNDNFCGREN